MAIGDHHHHFFSPIIQIPQTPQDTHLLPYSPSDAPTFTCDEFRMYEFKVRRCTRLRSHDWTECPYSHPNEKARRRDPRKFRYSAAACAEFRKGGCSKGDSCEYSHGVFECWLHPDRYRTQPCKDGVGCRRRVCFFAHTVEQLRVVGGFPRSPTSTLDVVEEVRRLRLVGSPVGRVKAFPVEDEFEEAVNEGVAMPDISWVSDLLK